MNKDNSIRVGDITGAGIAVGSGARAQGTYTVTQEGRNEITELLEQLKKEIATADIPEGVRNVLLGRAVPQMEQALETDDPQSGLERGLERINDQLEGVGAVTKNVSGIAEKAMKVAQFASIAVKSTAPFLAAMT